MFVHHSDKPIYKLEFYIGSKEAMKQPLEPPKVTGVEIFKDPQTGKRKPPMKQFLEPNDATFAKIRKRISEMTLKVDYKRAYEAFRPPPVFQERKYPTRRVSSINSKNTEDRYQIEPVKPHPLHESHSNRLDRLNSRASFFSDDNEFRHVRKTYNIYATRASETDALSKLSENILTPRQNPELFSRQIRLKDKPDIHARSDSPKSSESTGKVHLGLIESLDLNEKLEDLDRIKERYSSDEFMNSLSLYKLRGHDRCLYNDGLGSDHIPRGTRLMSPDTRDSSSRLSLESSTTITSVLSPRYDIKFRLTHAPNKEWNQDDSQPGSPIQAHPRPYGAPRPKGKQSKKRKSVGFDMNPKEIIDENASKFSSPSPRSSRTSFREPKSILKRVTNQDIPTPSLAAQKSQELDSRDEEFLTNANFRWRFQLPKIHSPVAPARQRPPSIAFRKKMYHFGDGISREFEAVINNYGNCRQPSMVKDKSFHRDTSSVKS